MNILNVSDLTEKTGQLYGDLWTRYSDQDFEHSVLLIYERMKANGFDTNLIQDKRCIDIGCGGGRASALMANLGAKTITAVDISQTGLTDAARRLDKHTNIEFLKCSCLDLPFDDSSYDFSWCSGVLHHTPNPERGLSEVVRITKPSGVFFLLLYGVGGIRWNVINELRPIAQIVGYPSVDKACKLANLPANKQRHFLDDLFVPILNFYTRNEIVNMLKDLGINKIKFWNKGKADDEMTHQAQLDELIILRSVFSTLKDNLEVGQHRSEGQAGCDIIDSFINDMTEWYDNFTAGRVTINDFNDHIFGAGLHRLVAEK